VVGYPGHVTLSTATRLAPTSRVEVKALDDRGVIVDMHSGRCWELNPVGFRIWQHLADGRSLEEVSQIIASQYGIETEVSVRDVTDLARSLVDAGLLAPASVTPPSREGS
jgi:Coenzyme PQQ synthesis protein D (PqqD)